MSGLSNEVSSEDQKRLMRGVLGLANLGNTCYMNSALQALRSYSKLTVFCYKHMHNQIQKKDSKEAKMLLAQSDLSKAIWGGAGPGQVVPKGFFDELAVVVKGTIQDEFTARTPQDAHEFLVWLLDQMQMAMQQEVKMTILENPQRPAKNTAAVQAWRSAFEKQWSPLTDMFFGMLHIGQHCHKCRKEHVRWETFNVLKVPLVRCSGTNTAEFEDCVFHEFIPEEIDGQDCDTCKEKTKVTKKTHIWRLPKLLIITLSRFTPMRTRDNLSLDQDGEPVCFDELFHPQSTEDTRSVNQELTATVDHQGFLMGGHQKAQARSPVYGTWHEQDDETVREIAAPKFGPQTQILFLRVADGKQGQAE